MLKPMKRQWDSGTSAAIRVHFYHDDVIKWKHFPRYSPFVRGIHRSLVNSPHKGQWRGALMFSLNCAWINVWVNNREAGDLRHHRTYYDVTVMNTNVSMDQVSYLFAQIPKGWSLEWNLRSTFVIVLKHNSLNIPIYISLYQVISDKMNYTRYWETKTPHAIPYNVIAFQVTRCLILGFSDRIWGSSRGVGWWFARIISRQVLNQVRRTYNGCFQFVIW